MKTAMGMFASFLWLALALPAAAQSQAEPALPYSPSLDLSSMDKSVDPCVNFYQYSCGRWQKDNPIPSDQTSWSVYGKLYQDNLRFLRGILDQAAKTGATRDTVTQEIGDFYAACIDEPEAERRGINALKPQLDAISRLDSKHELASLVAKLQLYVGGYRSLLFQAGSDQDPDNSEQVIAELGQGGLGLPDRDNYSEGKLNPKPTGYEHKKLTPRYPTFAGREPNFRPPFERISRLQIPLTRGKKGLKRNSAFKRSRQPDLMALLVRRKAPAAVVELVCRPSQASAADTSL